MTRPKRLGLIIGIVFAVVVAIAAGLLFVARPMATKVSAPSATQKPTPQQSPATQMSIIKGDPNAEVTLIEYGDFKCPLCNRFFYQTEPQITARYLDAGKVKLEFIPLGIIAPDSVAAGNAAYCAADQEKGGTYTDTLLRSIGEAHYQKGDYSVEETAYFTPQLLKQLAVGVVGDAKAFGACVDSGKYNQRIQNNTAEARAKGVQGTPTFMIGTQTIRGAQPFGVLSPLLESQLR